MALVGFVGVAKIIGLSPAFALVGQVSVDTVITYTLSILPLFIMMGNLRAHRRRFSRSSPGRICR